jgi:hypothetical protein
VEYDGDITKRELNLRTFLPKLPALLLVVSAETTEH